MGDPPRQAAIAGATKRIEKLDFPNHPIGPLYSVLEPDLLEEIKKRAAGIEWDKRRTEVAARAENVLRKGKHLPAAIENKSYWVDVVSTTSEDIKLPDGRMSGRSRHGGSSANQSGHSRNGMWYSIPLEKGNRGSPQLDQAISGSASDGNFDS